MLILESQLLWHCTFHINEPFVSSGLHVEFILVISNGKGHFTLALLQASNSVDVLVFVSSVFISASADMSCLDDAGILDLNCERQPR